MNNQSDKTYWKSLAQRDADANMDGDVDELIAKDPYGNSPAAISRRRFLEAAGFTVSLAAVSGCGRTPTETALPFAIAPEGTIPGRTKSYASTCSGCPAGCGLLVSVRDGRPIKMEGMPEHPLSQGGLCAASQAMPLGLYDSYRLKDPLHQGKPAKWDQLDMLIIKQLDDIEKNNGVVRIVTPTLTSPTLKATIDTFLKKFKDARHVIVDPVSSSAILDAHTKTHGVRLLPQYKIDQAKVIVSFGADFLGTWISPVQFTAAWRKGRVPTEKNRTMSYHVHLEGRMSLTGSNADRRHRLSPDEYGVTLSHLAAKLAKLAKQSPPEGTLGNSPLADADLNDIVERLWHARGECILLCDSQDLEVQILVNYINQILGNYGKTIGVKYPSLQKQSNDSDVLKLLEELKAGKVAALFVAGTDLLHNLPEQETLTKAISKIPLTVSFAQREDNFSALATFVCPDHHPLESWLDAQPTSEMVSLSQPMLQPLMNSRSILESLTNFSGGSGSAYDILQASWKKKFSSKVKYPKSLPAKDRPKSFVKFWDKSVHDGFIQLRAKPAEVGEFQSTVVKLISTPPTKQGYLLTLYPSIAIPDSSHAHNPWLQELPDPITKVTWDNFISLSQDVAKKLDLTDGDIVTAQSADKQFNVDLPILIQPGQHDRVLSISLGYGVKGTDRFAKIGPQWLESKPTVEEGELVGKNAAGFIQLQNGAIQYNCENITIKKTGRQRSLATTQEYHSLEVPKEVAPHGAEVRDIVQEVSLADYIKNPAAGTPHFHHDPDKQLWAEDHPKTRHFWGMALDLNACTGCSACLIACQSENNVPVVGKDEVDRQREMHWLRVDRYYSGEDDDLSVAHQPMMCQHCGNAPCETVCPVLATVGGDEGLNEQAYNRCVGTRYCANNCPYKVRRFNWFKYERDDSLQNLVLNPDVTVRSRGVMEKCSMCVQRIEEGKIEAKRLGLPVVDGEIQTACQQSCPAQAITFGDMNDPQSQIHAALQDPRRYRVLEELNSRPSVSYLRTVKNRDDNKANGGHHE